MAQLIDKDALVAEIEKHYNECLKRAKIVDSDYWNAKADAYRNVLVILDDTLEVKESKLPNPCFPHLNNIVDKIFGAGNLESWEYEQAEQLVLLAKEELLKDLEVKEVNLDVETDKWYNNEASKEFENVLYKDIEKCAKHFFELGLKAQKGEEI